jgi:hypothetical protein
VCVCVYVCVWGGGWTTLVAVCMHAVGDLLRPTGCLGSPCALMDPGHPSYKAHLLAMAHTMLSRAPSSGLCVDRQDMVGGVINDRADDGRTYYTANQSKISAAGGGGRRVASYLRPCVCSARGGWDSPAVWAWSRH